MDAKGQSSFKQALINTLHFMRITDPHDGLISISNLALLMVVAKIALSKQTPTAADLGALLLTFANYNAKKMLAPKPEKPEEKIA